MLRWDYDMKKDVCIIKIEQIWEDGKDLLASGDDDAINYLSKSVRTLVFYTRTPDGVPVEYISSVQNKVDFLEKLLPNMGVDDAITAIGAIKYSRRQLKVQPNRGNAFKRGLTKAEIERARRIGNPTSLNGISVAADLQSASTDVFDDLDEFRPGLLDDDRS